jgi:integrase
MKKQRTIDRLYRKRARYYADFRDFAAQGGALEALKMPGEPFATLLREEAIALAKARLRELRALRERSDAVPGVDLTRLGDFVDFHMVAERQETTRSTADLQQAARRLEAAIRFFGGETRLRQIETADLQRYIRRLHSRGLQAGTLRKYIAALAKLFRRARVEKVLPTFHRPVDDLINLPGRERTERAWLEVPDAALLLHAASLYHPKRGDIGLPYAHELVATLLLTGGRPAAVYGLLTSDLNFERETITFRANSARRLKNPGARRSVRMWPDLRRILQAYLESPYRPTGPYLFPSPANPARPLASAKRLMAELGLRIGLPNLTPKMCRHTYCAARLQTLDSGRAGGRQ